MKTVFVHPERCIGCMQCQAACAVEHSQSKNLFLAALESPMPRARIHVSPGPSIGLSFPNKCRHCDPAPCMSVCPTGAIYRPEDHPEIVLIDESKCIACAMCAVVCPFDVIVFHPSPKAPYKDAVAIKCDHCIERQREGKPPACVEVCKVGALEFGEINELLKKARTRYSEAVSVAVGQVPTQVLELPAGLTVWRDWGEAVSRVNKA